MKLSYKIVYILIVLLKNNSIIYPENKKSPGFLCVIEGVDGSGKSSLIKNLECLFQKVNIKVIFTKEPGATNLGKKIRKMILEDEIEKSAVAEFLLFAADRAQHFYELIIPNLNKDNVIISDRMSDSSIVYQGYLKGIDISMITMINSWCMQEIQPDLIIYLKISAQDVYQRIIAREESDLFEQKLINHLQEIIDAFDSILLKRDNVFIIDANQNTNIIAEQVFRKIVKSYQFKINKT